MPDSLLPERPEPQTATAPASGLDVPLRVTLFPDHRAQSKSEIAATLRTLCARLADTRAPSKGDLPWLKLATFGDNRTIRGSLRHDANVTSITGIEGDYDGEQLTMDRARRVLMGARIAAVLYTSPSHRPEAPRWRILCPLSEPLPPEERTRLLMRMNGLFVGALSGESFTLSQSYYYGAVQGAQHHAVATVEGRCIDLADDLDADAIGKPAKHKQEAPQYTAPAQPYTGDGTRYGQAALSRECANIRSAAEGMKHQTLNKAAYSIGGLVTAGELPEGAALSELRAALADIRDRCDDYPHAEKTLRTAFAQGMAAPRAVPERPAVAVARAPFGIPDGEALPSDVDPETGEIIEPPAQQQPAGPLWVDADTWDAKTIPPRPWAVPGYLMRGSVSVLTGQGAGGKSSLVVAWTIACATGEALAGFAPRGAMVCINYNVEDDQQEQRRRYSAALTAADLAAGDVMPRIVRCGPHDVGTLFERDPNTGRIVETNAMTTLEKLVVDRGAAVLICDPLAELHNAEENDNTAMRSVVAAFRSMARRHNIAILLLHHNRKGSSTPGDMDQMRGASAISGAVRVVLTLAPMTAEEADKLGVQPDQRRRHFRVDGAKSNYAIAGEAEWWKLTGYPIGNGEEVAAARPWAPPSPFGDLSMAACVDVLTKMHRGTPAGHAYAAKKQAGADWAGTLLMAAPHSRTEGQAATILHLWKEAKVIEEGSLEGPRRGHPRIAYAVNIDAVSEMRRQIREGIDE